LKLALRARILLGALQLNVGVRHRYTLGSYTTWSKWLTLITAVTVVAGCRSVRTPEPPSALVVRVLRPADDQPQRGNGPVWVAAQRPGASKSAEPLAAQRTLLGGQVALGPLPVGPVVIRVQAPGFRGEYRGTVRRGCADILTLVLPFAFTLHDGPDGSGQWRASGCAPGVLYDRPRD
jgi:hypothetical protein